LVASGLTLIYVTRRLWTGDEKESDTANGSADLPPSLEASADRPSLGGGGQTR